MSEVRARLGARALGGWVVKLSVDGAVCVEGTLEGEGRAWVTTPIRSALQPDHLLTHSGSHYLLIGPMDRTAARSLGYPSDMIEHFDAGFPTNWRSLLDDFIARVTARNKFNVSEWSLFLSPSVLRGGDVGDGGEVRGPDDGPRPRHHLPPPRRPPRRRRRQIHPQEPRAAAHAARARGPGPGPGPGPSTHAPALAHTQATAQTLLQGSFRSSLPSNLFQGLSSLKAKEAGERVSKPLSPLNRVDTPRGKPGPARSSPKHTPRPSPRRRGPIPPSPLAGPPPVLPPSPQPQEAQAQPKASPLQAPPPKPAGAPSKETPIQDQAVSPPAPSPRAKTPQAGQPATTPIVLTRSAKRRMGSGGSEPPASSPRQRAQTTQSRITIDLRSPQGRGEENEEASAAATPKAIEAPKAGKSQSLRKSKAKKTTPRRQSLPPPNRKSPRLAKTPKAPSSQTIDEEAQEVEENVVQAASQNLATVEHEEVKLEEEERPRQEEEENGPEEKEEEEEEEKCEEEERSLPEKKIPEEESNQDGEEDDEDEDEVEEDDSSSFFQNPFPGSGFNRLC